MLSLGIPQRHTSWAGRQAELIVCRFTTASFMLHVTSHAGAPMHWRLRREAGLTAEDAGTAPALAFQGLKVIFYGKGSSPSFETLVKILKAGGGEVLRRGAPYTSCLPAGAPHTAAGSSKKKGQLGKKSSAAAAAAQSDGAAANLAIIGADKEDASDK